MRLSFLAPYVMEESSPIATGCNFIEMTPQQRHVSKPQSLQENQESDAAFSLSNTTENSAAATAAAICPICYDEYENDNTNTPEQPLSSSLSPYQITTAKQRQHVAECDHEFCHECLVQHCKIAIMSKQTPIPCPQVIVTKDMDIKADENNNDNDAQEQAKHCLSPELVKSLLTIKYSNRKEKQNEDARQLPGTVPRKDPKHNNATMEKDEKHNSLNSNNEEMEDEIGHDVESGWEKHSASTVQLTRTFSTETGSSFASMSSSASSSSSCSSSSEYWNKYMRIQRLKEDPTLLVCPRCEELVVCPLDKKLMNKTEIVDAVDESNTTCEKEGADGVNNSQSALKNGEIPPSHKNESLKEQPLYPEVECPSCCHTFCCIHGDIHAGESCAHFCTSQRARDMEQSERILNTISKHCSNGCGARIIRESGCDHVLCTNCNHDMCYKCGTHEFLTGKVIRSCSKCKQGFVDHRYYAQYRLRLLFILPFHLLLSAIYMAVVAVVALLTCCFGCFFQCGTRGWAWEQGQTESSSSANNGRLNPVRGISMTTRAICMPMIELMVECGFIHGEDDDH